MSTVRTTTREYDADGHLVREIETVTTYPETPAYPRQTWPYPTTWPYSPITWTSIKSGGSITASPPGTVYVTNGAALA